MINIVNDKGKELYTAKNSLKITLPFPPTVNNAYPTSKQGRRYKSKDYKIWLSRCPKLEELKLEHVKIEYSLYFPDNRIRDCSNYIKVIEDYLVSGGLLIDDNWHVIGEFSVKAVGIDKENPRVEIELTEI